MKAVVYDAPASYTITEVPAPEPRPGEVRVRVRQTGICGTDLHIHNGKFFAEFPLTPGHELVGPVDALGAGTEGFRVGEYVSVPANLVYSVDGIDPDVPFTEPTACAVHGVQTLSPPPGSSALVFGAGPTGLLLAQLIARGGAVSVTVASGGFDLVVDATGAAAVWEQCVPLTRSHKIIIECWQP